MSELLQDLIIVFSIGVGLVMILHRFNLPSALGFLVTGVICGPSGLKLVEDVHAIEVLSEIGLVLLLFEAGIEFSVKTFLRMRRFLLIAGGIDSLLTSKDTKINPLLGYANSGANASSRCWACAPSAQPARSFCAASASGSTPIRARPSGGSSPQTSVRSTALDGPPYGVLVFPMNLRQGS